MALSEFSLIERFFAPLGANAENKGVVLGIGDDCALLETPPGQQLALSVDTLVAGTHFLADTAAAQIASRAMAACVSDLAAMGAEPKYFTLALTLPTSDTDWLSEFSQALASAAKAYDMALIGGDTTKGPVLTISLQVHGWVPSGKALRRDQAQVGDAIFVTGTLGDSAAGLDQLQNGLDNAELLSRFYEPSPRISTGILLRDYASAALDISDGLLADLGHILERSDISGALIELEKLPLSTALTDNYATQQAQQFALSGGEDFELCFTVPSDKLAAFATALEQHPVNCTRIGELTATPGIRLQDGNGQEVKPTALGYQHF